MDQTDSYPVKLYVYDLSKGMARQMSPIMLGEFCSELPDFSEALTWDKHPEL